MLFTDIEGSTRLAASLGKDWAGVLGAYHEVVEGAARTFGGWVDGTAGDGFFITFGVVADAGRAAVAIQRALRSYPWPTNGAEVKVRMGVHVGHVERRGHGYVGLEIHRAARVGAAAHGGQVLMTGVAAELLSEVVSSQPLGAHRLKDFPAPTALYCAVIDGQGAGSFPPPRTLELSAGNVPVASTGLVGRQADLARVRVTLREEHQRIVTLLGRGGVGKTSLALAAAHDLLEEYDGGVWWIDASQERDGAALLEAIARGCRIETQASLEEAVISDLGSRGTLLLVLDNLEQVDGAGRLLDRLLARLANLAVLATSQLPLRCPGERQVHVEQLGEADALDLLARVADRLDIAVDEDPVAAAELVRLLDGLPLAIELAAGRLRLFPLAELVARLRESTAILQDRTRTDRQRSLSAALEWTLELLDPEARELFTRLGVFAGPVELEDIEEVVGGEDLDVLSAAAALLDAALLQRVETGDGFVRFALPEAIRQEAVRRLDARDCEHLRRAHAAWQHDRVWPLRIYEIVELRPVQRAHGTAADTRAALTWAWEHDRQLGREIALGRYPLAHRAGAVQEGRELMDRVMADPGENPQVVDLARQHATLLARPAIGATGDHARALIALFPELSDLYARFLCAQNAGIALTWEARFDEALAWLQQARQLAREISPLAEASVLVIVADTLFEADRPDAAAAAVAESEALANPERFSLGAREFEVIRATLASVAGAHAEALGRYGHALTDAEVDGDANAIWMITVSLVRAFARAGRESSMLEAAGAAQAIAAERSAQGDYISGVFLESEPAVRAVLARRGAAAQAIVDAGRALEPAHRVKRLCSLIYAD